MVTQRTLLLLLMVVSSKLTHLFSLSNGIGRCADDKPFVPTYQVSKEKGKSLGIEFVPLDISLKETVESLKEKSFVSFWVLSVLAV